VPSLSRRWSNRRIAAVVLAVMVSMALVGLVLALATQTVRRSHDSGLPKDRTLPLYLSVFVGIWIIGLAFVTVRELQARYQRSSGAQRLPIGYILSTIFFLALGGLAVTMLAVQISTQRASRPALESEIQTVPSVPPASLSSLGYLPADTDLVAGIHVAEALADPSSKDIVTHFAFGPGIDVSAIEKWTGLSVKEMDHIVLGLRVRGMLTPRMEVVVHTVRPYGAEAIRKKLNVSHYPIAGKSEVYRLTVDKSLLTPYLWFVDDRTLIVGGSAKDLEAVPNLPQSGPENLRPELGELLREGLGQGTPLWVAGAPREWDQTLIWSLLLSQQSKEERALLAKISTFGVGFQFGNGLALNAAIYCADDTTAVKLESYFTGHDLGEKKPFHLNAPRPHLEPIYRELGQSVKAEREQSWLILQAKARAETLHKAIHP
jgi:hypothetical protein